MAGGYLLMLRVNRPLQALASAAGEIGAGKTPAPLDENGPTEIRMLSHAFNQMTADLKRIDADRAVLLAGISHDLRTPLTHMRSLAEVALEAGANREQLSEALAECVEESDLSRVAQSCFGCH